MNILFAAFLVFVVPMKAFSLGYFGIGGGGGKAGDANLDYRFLQLSLGGAKDRNEGVISISGGNLGAEGAISRLTLYQLAIRRHFGNIQDPWIGTGLTYFDSKNESVIKTGVGVPLESGIDFLCAPRVSLGLQVSVYPLRSFYQFFLQLKIWGDPQD